MDEIKNQPPLESDAELVATHNVFADIIAGRAPVSEIYRDDLVIAFMDIQPINPGHTLVVPLRAARFLDELTDEEAAHIFVVGRKVARAIRASGLPCTGVTLFLADGVTGGQEVPHVHLHVVPRFAGDGFGFTLPERYFQDVPERERLDEDAATLRAALSLQD
jgi:histidine triad (HIT) family protein